MLKLTPMRRRGTKGSLILMFDDTLWVNNRVRLGARKQPFDTMRLTGPARLLPPVSDVRRLQAATKGFDRPPG